VFERRLLRKLVGLKAGDERMVEKMIGTPNQILLSLSRMMTRTGHVISEDEQKCLPGLVVKPEGKRSLGRNKLRRR
jgi:hypothetical protein